MTSALPVPHAGSTRYGPYRIATSSGAGTCLCNTNYLCSFDITTTVQDPVPSTSRAAMIYGTFFGATGCGGKGEARMLHAPRPVVCVDCPAALYA